MAATLGHDIGFTLSVRCDQCPEPIMAFGQGSEGRPELEAMIRAEGWHQLGGDGWLCPRCGTTSVTAGSTGQPMTEAEWLTCADPMPMLEFLQDKASDRKLRLFVCSWFSGSSHWSSVADIIAVGERYA